MLHVVPSSQTEKVLKRLDEEGYEEGPGSSANLMLREGDVLEVGFRGNVKAEEERASPSTMIYNSQLPTSLKTYIVEVDKFLQKNYPVYRGFVQVHRKVKIPPPPYKWGEETKEDEAPKDEYKLEFVCEHLVSIPKVSVYYLMYNLRTF